MRYFLLLVLVSSSIGSTHAAEDADTYFSQILRDAEVGNEDSQIRAGNMYKYGMGVTRDLAEAERLYSLGGRPELLNPEPIVRVVADQQQLEEENEVIRRVYEGFANCAAFYMTSIEVLRASMSASNARQTEDMIEAYSQSGTVMMTMASLGASTMYSTEEASNVVADLISTTVESMKEELWNGRTEIDRAFVSRYTEFNSGTCESMLDQGGDALQSLQ